MAQMIDAIDSANVHAKKAGDFVRDLIVKAILTERKRCRDIVSAARFGDIDGDLRSLISRIESGDTDLNTKD